MEKLKKLNFFSSFLRHFLRFKKFQIFEYARTAYLDSFPSMERAVDQTVFGRN